MSRPEHIRLDTPTLSQGIVVAIVLAFAGAALFAGLTVLVSPNIAIRLLTTLLGGVYSLYLLGCSAQRTGRIVAVALWCIAAAAAAWLINSLALLLIAHVVMVWLLRSMYFHGSIVAALADLGLSALALAAAVWAATSSGSVWLSVWCLFLVQALFVVLPRSPATQAHQSDADNSEFERARRSAEAALRRLAAIN